MSEHNPPQVIFFGFVPKPLDIPDRPELAIFPLNVLFVRYGQIGGKNFSGSALYEPNLASFKMVGEKVFLEYRNIYGGDSFLVIEYDVLNERYLGIKTVNNKNVGEASGKEWKMFFVHFTSLGLAAGEQCKFEVI